MVSSLPPADTEPETGGSHRRVALISAIVLVVVLVAGLVTWIVAGGDDDGSATNGQVAATAGITAPKGYRPKFTTVECPADVTAAAAGACADTSWCPSRAIDRRAGR